MSPSKFLGLKNIKITSISCNSIAAFFLSEDGTVYSYGDDSKSQFGLLGLGKVFTQFKPTPLRTLFDYHIQSICVGHSHACALSSTGSIFSWGTGNKGQLGIPGLNRTDIPTKLKTEIKFLSITCSYNYTALTSSSSLYILGTLKNSSFYCTKNSSVLEQIYFLKSPSNNNLQPVYELENIPLEKIVPGEGFLVCLTTKGQTLYVNEDLSITWITFKNLIEDITTSENGIYGLANKGKIIYEWKPWVQTDTLERFREDYATRIYKISGAAINYIGFCELPSAGGTTAMYYEGDECTDSLGNLYLIEPSKEYMRIGSAKLERGIRKEENWEISTERSLSQNEFEELKYNIKLSPSKSNSFSLISSGELLKRINKKNVRKPLISKIEEENKSDNESDVVLMQSPMYESYRSSINTIQNDFINMLLSVVLKKIKRDFIVILKYIKLKILIEHKFSVTSKRQALKKMINISKKTIAVKRLSKLVIKTYLNDIHRVKVKKIAIERMLHTIQKRIVLIAYNEIHYQILCMKEKKRREGAEMLCKIYLSHIKQVYDLMKLFGNRKEILIRRLEEISRRVKLRDNMRLFLLRLKFNRTSKFYGAIAHYIIFKISIVIKRYLQSIKTYSSISPPFISIRINIEGKKRMMDKLCRIISNKLILKYLHKWNNIKTVVGLHTKKSLNYSSMKLNDSYLPKIKASIILLLMIMRSIRKQFIQLKYSTIKNNNSTLASEVALLSPKINRLRSNKEQPYKDIEKFIKPSNPITLNKLKELHTPLDHNTSLIAKQKSHDEVLDAIELPSECKNKGKYHQEAFIQAFSNSLIKYYAYLTEEEKHFTSTYKDNNILKSFDIKKKSINNNRRSTISNRSSYPRRSKDVENDYIRANKKYVGLMSTLNSELNTRLKQATSRYGKLRTEPASQLTRCYKEKTYTKLSNHPTIK